MKSCSKGFAAALLLAVSCLPVHAEDTPAATTTTPNAAAPGDARPAVVPRPSIAPKATDKAMDAAPAATSDAPRRYRRAAYRTRRYAYWEPFPLYFPHLYHHRIVWNRHRWF